MAPAYIKELKAKAKQHADEIGRDFSTLKWNAVMVFAMDEDRDSARRAARDAICHFYAPLPHPYYEFTMREQGFGDVADQLLELMPAGHSEAAHEAISDECLDTISICGTPAECVEKIRAYRGLLDEMLLLNVMPARDGDPLSSYASLFAILAKERFDV